MRSPLLMAWAMVVVWVLVHALIKTWGQAGLDIDSAEQVYFAQSLQMGYGTRQPPLYTWLLLAFKPAQASWVLTLEVARYACLLLWLGGVQALARVCGANVSVQARVILVHMGLLLAMWRVHDSLTHTVLASAITLWGSVALVKALRHPPYWLWVGVLSALACLAKLNAALWCASSFMSAWIVIALHARTAQPGTSRAVVRAHAGWMLAALLAFLMLMAPYGQWWVSRPGAGVMQAQRIVVSNEAVALWVPIRDVLLGSLEYVLLGPFLVAALAWRLRLRAGKQMSSIGGQWLIWQTGCGLLVLALALMAMKGTHFTPRWLWPVVPGLTVWMAMWAFQLVDLLDDARWRKVFVFVTWAMPVMAICLAGLRLWEPARTAQQCRNCWTDRPAALLSVDLHRLYGPQALRVITGDAHLAGILAQVTARDLTWAADSLELPPPDGFARGDAPCVAVWLDVDEPKGPPPGLRMLMGSHAVSAPSLTTMPFRLAPQRRFSMQSVALTSAACAQAALN